MTKGQALYGATGTFKPPTEPLTTTSQGAIASNVKLLCANQSTITGATVAASIPLNHYGSANAASTDNPFNAPECYKFGADKDQDIIKCGMYTGNASQDFKVHLGWEPQFIIFKRTSIKYYCYIVFFLKSFYKQIKIEIIVVFFWKVSFNRTFPIFIFKIWINTSLCTTNAVFSSRSIRHMI